MKKIIICHLFFFLFCSLGFSQQPLIRNIQVKIQTPFFSEAKTKLINYIKEKNAIEIYRYETTRDLTITFFVENQESKQLDSLFKELGYLSQKKINTENYSKEKEKIQMEINYLNDKKSTYNKELNEIDKKNDRYYKYWEEVREVEKKIFDLNKELTQYKNNNLCKIEINLYDESVDLTERSIKWVNMPGASFDMLFTESPTPEISAQQYLGFSIKYVFTRGKTYANIGAMKEFSDESLNDLRFKEIFLFGFGQDFYSKYFGRGKNQFFNLYTGYNIGGGFITGETRNKTIFYLTPFIGVEIFKNKYFLIDNRVGYFVPFAYNRNLRGVAYTASFNFVF